MKIFVFGVPHTQTSTKFTTCAFTMKVYNLCRMMLNRGHEVIHLGVEGSDVPCTQHVSVATEEYWLKTFGHPGSKFYNMSTDGEQGKYLDAWANKAKDTLNQLMGDDYTNILACTWGGPQMIAAKNVPQFAVESGIGYKHVWADYKVFESYAWQHMIYGEKKKFDGNFWLDAVIPNAFDPDMFEFKEKKEDYFLFIGRLNDDKGVQLAIDVSKKVGRKIKIVGQGDPARFLKSDHVEYIPPVGIEERKQLMANAACILCPTYYVEPFCGVNVEAQMSGTPVISTDWGVFPETVLHGITGYRCRMLEQFIWAAKNIGNIKPVDCRNWAFNNFRLDHVGLMYEEYFTQVLTMKYKGWTTENPDRKDLDYLKKIYPI